MNKAELIKKISDDSGISVKQAGIVLNTILSSVSNTLKEGNRVSLTGFGTWSTIKRGPREGRNPITGKTIKIASKKVVKFKPSNNLIGDDDTGPLIQI